MSRSQVDRAGTERVAEVARKLNSHTNFWKDIDEALSRVGLTKDYVERFSPIKARRKLKYFKDSVWGMMEFSRDEVALIDSPLLQRLRGIKQTGFTFLTYDGAEHSRFSHTLGVTFVVKKLLKTVSDLASSQPSFTAGGQEYSLFKIDERPELERALVHAALLHDIGHLGFSHASESALKTHVNRVRIGSMPLLDLVDYFREMQIDSELSEILSIVLCLSPRFREFYSKIYPEADGEGIYRICCFISGIAHDPNFPGLTNIISGAVVDADKIDYINRDSLYCGIPAGIDVSRIFFNTSLVRIEVDQAEKIAQKTRQGIKSPRIKPGVHFIVNSAGMDTYDEMATSKSILYHRVYLHQATRNAEQMLAECFSRLCHRGSKAGAQKIDVLEYYPLRDQQLIDKLMGDADTRELAARINNRDLPKRAFVLFRDVCEPFIKITDLFAEGRGGDVGDMGLVDKDAALLRTSSWRIWSELVPFDPLELPQRLENLRQKIREGAVELREHLDKNFYSNNLSRSEPYVGLAPRYMLKPASEVLVREKNSIGRSVYWTKSEELTVAENLFKAADYFFADEEWVKYVRIATVRAIFQFGRSLGSVKIDDISEPNFDFEPAQFEVMPTMDFLLEDISSRIGADYDEMIKDMRAAADAGFFGNAHRLVPLDRAQESACDRIVEKYSGFLGERGWHVSARSAMNFIRQFPVDLRDQAIELSLSGDALSRIDFTEGIWSAVKDLDEKGDKLIFCRFSPNSGNFIGMLFEQDTYDTLKKRGHEFCRNFAELERSLEAGGKRTVVFIDDQFGSGSQACAQLYHWAKVERSKWPKSLQGERNIDFTDPTVRFVDFLRKERVVLGFLFGTPEGQALIERTAKELGFENVLVKSKVNLPSKGTAISKELKEFLVDVGTQVLQYCRRDDTTEAASAEVCRADALGYGGKASLIVTPYNVPSHSITAFWCPGIFNELPWVPLFLRRGYRKHLVIG